MPPMSIPPNTPVSIEATPKMFFGSTPNIGAHHTHRRNHHEEADDRRQ